MSNNNLKKAIEVINVLLECTELNLDETDLTTQAAILHAEEFLDEYHNEGDKNG